MPKGRHLIEFDLQLSDMHIRSELHKTNRENKVNVVRTNMMMKVLAGQIDTDEEFASVSDNVDLTYDTGQWCACEKLSVFFEVIWKFVIIHV